MRLQHHDKTPDAPISGVEADELFKNMFKDPSNPYKDEWFVAAHELKALDLQKRIDFIHLIDQQIAEEKKREQEAQYAFEEMLEQQDKLAEDAEQFAAAQRKLIATNASLSYPELIPSFMSITYHLEQWEDSERELESANLHRDVVQAANVKFMLNEFADVLQPDIAAEIKEQFKTPTGLLNKLHRITALNDNIQLKEKELLEKIENPTLEQQIEIKQKAHEGLAQRETHLNELKLVQLLRKNFQELKPEELLAKYGNKNALQVANMFAKKIDFKTWEKEILSINNRCILNNMQRECHQASVNEQINHLVANTHIEPKFRDELKSILNKLPQAEVGQALQLKP